MAEIWNNLQSDSVKRASQKVREVFMRKWFVPLTVIGLSGLGLAAASPTARRRMNRFFQAVAQAPSRLETFNDVLESELDTIQRAINEIAQALGSTNSATR